MPARDAVAALLDAWEADAATLARRGDPRGAELIRQLVGEARAAIAETAGDVLTLAEAARLSGYSADHLRALVAEGKIPNAGAKYRPAIRRADVPRKPGATPAAPPSGYDVGADVASLSHRLRKA